MNRSLSSLLTILCFFGLINCSHDRVAVPVLILAGNADFGTYTGEILKAEGFNEFKADSLNSGRVTSLYLRQFDLVILAKSHIDPIRKKMLLDFVKKGGNIIAFRPDPVIEELFGIDTIVGNIQEGFIRIDTATKEGKALTFTPVQFHGISDKYKVTSGRNIASLYSDTVTGTNFPAVVSNDYGKGHAIAFSYNLPENIVYTRQGNPLNAGKETDGINGIRPMDMFTSGWLQPSGNLINQADEQMKLLTHCIEEINNNSKPLPRFWYFPDSLKCLATLTNDGEYRSDKDFEGQFRDVDSMGAKMSIYVMDCKKVSKGWTDKWTSKGFEISGHPDDTKEASSPVWNNMNDILTKKIKEIKDLYGLTMKTVANHWFVWCGIDSSGNPEFSAQAEIEVSHGLSLDANYAHYDNNSVQGHFLGPCGTDQGNFTGSGLLMKFASSNGRILDIYQLLTNVYDQQYNENHDPDGFFNCFKGLMDRSMRNEVYSFISVKSHNDEYYFSKIPLIKMLAYAESNGIPVWTASRLLDFIKMKDEAGFSHIKWSQNSLTFTLSSSTQNSEGLSFLLPAVHENLRIAGINIDGIKRNFQTRIIKGTEYSLITVKPGRNYEISAMYRKRV